MKYQIGKLFVWASMLVGVATLTAYPSYAADQESALVKKDAVISEEIKPEKITAETGFCYMATLTLERIADKQDEHPEKKANQSECILLEDGKPLSQPHSAHAEIREIGKGKYSHWTKGSIYFSTSDNSDPRTNGRKYTLISTRK
jgi:hypothetical protein